MYYASFPALWIWLLVAWGYTGQMIFQEQWYSKLSYTDTCCNSCAYCLHLYFTSLFLVSISKRPPNDATLMSFIICSNVIFSCLTVYVGIETWWPIFSSYPQRRNVKVTVLIFLELYFKHQYMSGPFCWYQGTQNSLYCSTNGT
jgi:hypothetical protein